MNSQYKDGRGFDWLNRSTARQKIDVPWRDVGSCQGCSLTSHLAENGYIGYPYLYNNGQFVIYTYIIQTYIHIYIYIHT